MAQNVLGDALEPSNFDPLTGFYRDGCCNTGVEDLGSHTVCVVTTAAFLEFSKARGNDLSTPMPRFGFAGLKQKLLGSIVAIAAVNVLEWFADIDRQADSVKLGWVVAILLTFAVAMLLLAIADRVSSEGSEH